MSILSPLPDAGLACDLNAFTPAQRDHHLAHAEALFGAVLELRELPDGYTVRTPDSPDMLAQLADFVAHERLCCPFLNFSIEVTAYGGPIWLRITGPEGAKSLVAAEITGLLEPQVALAAGLE
ncbi:MAG: hypothetical protein IPK52_19020 [Chloroflexi bacterium]|nr:hypothetical protein [Chloroflexota bacterium]